ncbi:PREDICTED: immunoglobulin-binding protein 1 [Bactrocera latifrons]|uniref:Immunoglobulin-binding protein 1 n=1 Tax=Bactrocera latifrons TaxID=174628 RepID=A0A0K8UPY6_BACLA|nr:PREDICTED: immunoglobulin-binding protein 1 [Bactrocera latifrons]
MSANGVSKDAQGSGDQSLQAIFSKGWEGFEELEETSLPFNSAEYQRKVKETMKKFEEATTIVNQIGLFSPNELIDEVSTDSLQYLMLPFYLGKIALKLQQESRDEVLQIAEVYFKDFLQRCQEYELCDEYKKNAVGAAEGGNTDELAQLMRAAHARNDKIAQFRKKKELDEFVRKMKLGVRNKSVDDEVRREFFLKLLNKSIIDATEELDSVQLEKQMVKMRTMHGSAVAQSNEHFDNVKAISTSDAAGHSHHHHHHLSQQPKKKPMQPFIITRNSAQKAVFGAGYPSLPVMTVDEFYDQRVREGVFPDEEKVAKMNREQAIAAAQDPNEKEDQEKAVEEIQVENDDPEYLARMRRMDEYKDVVRRGDGNRYNRS